MINLKKKFSDLYRNTDGQFSVMAGVSILTIVLSVGSAVDVSRVMHAKQKAQGIADSIALAAAVYIDQHGEPPQNGQFGFMHDTEYQAGNYGYEIYGSKNATFTVKYDDVNKEAVVELSGHIPTTFMQVAHYDNLGFSTRSTVKYKETDQIDPASIMFVLDNSGSMWFDDKPYVEGASSAPADAVRRIDALKTNLTTLNDRLQGIVDNETDTKFVRTGMLPYNDDIIAATRVNLHWGALTSSNISSMTPDGSTNSSPPMQEAWSQLQNDDVHHTNESGKTPLKYVIFMTDGQNTNGQNIWIPEEGTNHWRRTDTELRCWGWGWRRRCRNVLVEHFFPTDGPSDTPIPEPTNYPDWVEGKSVYNWDHYTQLSCEAMHEAGVKVYTVGFALNTGTYDANEWPGGSIWTVTPEHLSRSYGLLSACASEGDHFILADNHEELQEAFDRIGDDILLDVIRVKG